MPARYGRDAVARRSASGTARAGDDAVAVQQFELDRKACVPFSRRSGAVDGRLQPESARTVRPPNGPCPKILHEGRVLDAEADVAVDAAVAEIVDDVPERGNAGKFARVDAYRYAARSAGYREAGDLDRERRVPARVAARGNAVDAYLAGGHDAVEVEEYPFAREPCRKGDVPFVDRDELVRAFVEAVEGKFEYRMGKVDVHRLSVGCAFGSVPAPAAVEINDRSHARPSSSFSASIHRVADVERVAARTRDLSLRCVSIFVANTPIPWHT